MELKVMTYNIHHGKGIDGRPSLARIAEVVLESGAEIVGFNEVDRLFSARSGFIDQVSWISDKLDMYSAFGATVTRKREDAAVGEYGNALFSRFPIVSGCNHLLKAGRPAISEARALLEADIEVGGPPTARAKIFVTHLSLGRSSQRRQVQLIMNRIRETPNIPVILMGDMNMKSGSASWGMLAGFLQDAGRSAGAGPLRTFPSLRPIVQLDYIFTGASVHATAAKAITAQRLASDHLPLLATVNLNLST